MEIPINLIVSECFSKYADRSNFDITKTQESISFEAIIPFWHDGARVSFYSEISITTEKENISYDDHMYDIKVIDLTMSNTVIHDNEGNVMNYSIPIEKINKLLIQYIEQ